MLWKCSVLKDDNAYKRIMFNDDKVPSTTPSTQRARVQVHNYSP